MQSWTRACSLHQFFERPVCDYIDGQLTRVFAVCFPEDSHFLTQHQFWIHCLDFVAISKPKVRHPFNRLSKGHVYEKLERISTLWPFAVLFLSRTGRNHALPLLQGNYHQLLTDGLVSWKLNLFRSYAVGHNCPAPATYTGFVLHNSTNFREPLLSWFNTHHIIALTLFNFLVGDPQRYNTLRSSRRVTLNQENSTYIFRCGLTIQNHLEQAFPHTFKRHRLTPIASLKPTFVPFSTWVLNHFISKNTSQTILKNPYLLFKTIANDYTVSSNGDSVRITFKPRPKATRVRLAGEALTDKRSRGELDYYEITRNRKHTLQTKVERPRPRQKPKATEWQAPDDETEMVYWAIDPNHSNLCGSSIGTCSGLTVSNIFLAQKQRKINHSVSLTHSSIDIYDVQKMNHYLVEI
ncbi:hypothetical protein P9112_004438 [Eukaryota sp. TZLM1-RC]